MKLLALDTATEACSVALLAGDALIERSATLARGHAEEVLVMIDAVLAEAGLALANLDGIAASIGPGAFTGVRICVAVAQGLAFGAQLPVVPVTTLEALAAQVIGIPAIGTAARAVSALPRALACLDARMGEVYWASLRGDPGAGVVFEARPAVGAPGTVRPFAPGAAYRGIGQGFAAYPELAGIAATAGVELELEPEHRYALPRAREVARLGSLRLALGLGRDPAELQPLYLRDRVARTEAERAQSAQAPR